MAMTGTLLDRDKSGGTFEVLVTLVASGSYATNGDSLDFAPIAGFTNKQPDWVNIAGITANTYKYDKVNKKIIAFVPAGTEVPAGAYPAGITGDSIIARATWFR